MQHRVALVLVLAVLVAILIGATMYIIVLRGKYTSNASSGSEGVSIVVTFPILLDDLKQLTCNNDKVRVLTPIGIDPHAYQLTMSDLKLLKRADLIISTAHAPFEIKIRDIVAREKLIEITRIPGVQVLPNPNTGKPNYHGVIYDPQNYRTFLEYLIAKLATINPACKEYYAKRLGDIEERLETLMTLRGRVKADAVASSPIAVYAVEWTGIHVVLLLSPDPETPPTPSTIKRARELLKAGAYAVILVDRDGNPLSGLDKKLLDMAREYEATVIRVPSLFSEGSIVEKLEYIVDQLGEITVMLIT
jgi:zinc/manganese transport system substrate-binding protein